MTLSDDSMCLYRGISRSSAERSDYNGTADIRAWGSVWFIQATAFHIAAFGCESRAVEVVVRSVLMRSNNCVIKLYSGCHGRRGNTDVTKSYTSCTRIDVVKMKRLA